MEEGPDVVLSELKPALCRVEQAGDIVMCDKDAFGLAREPDVYIT
jgi:hypothetical protein